MVGAPASMLATPAEFEDLWNAAIKQDLVDSEDKKLFVFVSTAEADSVCALHILQVRGYSLSRCRTQPMVSYDCQARLIGSSSLQLGARWCFCTPNTGRQVSDMSRVVVCHTPWLALRRCYARRNTCTTVYGRWRATKR